MKGLNILRDAIDGLKIASNCQRGLAGGGSPLSSHPPSAPDMMLREAFSAVGWEGAATCFLAYTRQRIADKDMTPAEAKNMHDRLTEIQRELWGEMEV